jgi:hypothetical protein
MRTRVVGRFVAVALALTTWPASAAAPKKPRLELRATPRVAFSPVLVMATAELRGGDELEAFYCPEIEWNWDDGGRSARGQDCPPFEPGAALQRRFTAQHAYRSAGTYNVKVTMRRANHDLAAATATVMIQSGVGNNGSDQ